MSAVDAGTRVVSPSVDLSESAVGAYVTLAAVEPGGGAVIGAGDGTLRRIKLGGGAPPVAEAKAIGALPLAAAPHAPSGGCLVGTDDGRLLLWRPDGELKALAVESGQWVEHVAARDADGDDARIAYTAGRTVTVLNAAGDVVARLDDHPSTVAGIAFSPDGRMLAAAHYDGVSLHDLAKDGPAERLEWHGSHTALAWSPNGKFIVTAMQDREMHCWRLADRTGMRMSGYPSKIRTLSWTADSAYVVASGADTVTSWDCRGKGPSGKPPLEFGYVYNGTVTAVAAHPTDGVVAAGFSDGTVLIGHIEKGDAIIARPGGGAPVTAMAWRSDGTGLVAGTQAGELAVITMTGPLVG